MAGDFKLIFFEFRLKFTKPKFGPELGGPSHWLLTGQPGQAGPALVGQGATVYILVYNSVLPTLAFLV